MSADDARAARGLADVATIGILHARAQQASDAVEAQLQYALDSRVIIEQAEGVMTALHGINPDEAFRRLRHEARTTGRRLTVVAQEAVDAAHPA